MKFYEELWQQLPVPGFVIDRSDDIIELNIAAEQFVGVSRKLVLGHKAWTFILGENSIAEGVNQAKKGNTSLFINDISAHGRSMKPNKCSAQICSISMSKQQVLLLLIPIEGMAYRDEKMVQAASTKSVIGMSEMLAHEIKNPLAGIIGAAQFLSMSLTADDMEMTQLIVQESKRIVSLLEQVEQFGDLTPTKNKTLNIHDVLDQAIRTAELGFGDNITIIKEYDPSLPTFLGDKNQLVQAFLNLIKNALEAVDQNGMVIIKTFYDASLRLAKPILNGKKLPLHVEIIDNGSGLPDGIAQHIFEPFVSSKSNGKGLGLALVSKIISQHSAQIIASSTPERTMFRISFPISPKG